jgi:hypothetical protein
MLARKIPRFFQTYNGSGNLKFPLQNNQFRQSQSINVCVCTYSSIYIHAIEAYVREMWREKFFQQQSTKAAKVRKTNFPRLFSGPVINSDSKFVCQILLGSAQFKF